MNEHQSDPSAPELTLKEIKAIERGERTINQPKQVAATARQNAVNEAVTKSKQQAAAETGDIQDTLGDLLSMGANSEIPALTIGGIALLELLESPFLDDPVSGMLAISTIDTARALWAFSGGAAGCAPLLSALAMERAADALPPDYSTPLRVKAGELRGAWDSQALQTLEQCGKTKAELDAELIVRLRDIIAELGALK